MAQRLGLRLAVGLAGGGARARGAAADRPDLGCGEDGVGKAGLTRADARAIRAVRGGRRRGSPRADPAAGAGVDAHKTSSHDPRGAGQRHDAARERRPTPRRSSKDELVVGAQAGLRQRQAAEAVALQRVRAGQEEGEVGARGGTRRRSSRRARQISERLAAEQASSRLGGQYEVVQRRDRAGRGSCGPRAARGRRPRGRRRAAARCRRPGGRPVDEPSAQDPRAPARRSTSVATADVVEEAEAASKSRPARRCVPAAEVHGHADARRRVLRRPSVRPRSGGRAPRAAATRAGRATRRSRSPSAGPVSGVCRRPGVVDTTRARFRPDGPGGRPRRPRRRARPRRAARAAAGIFASGKPVAPGSGKHVGSWLEDAHGGGWGIIRAHDPRGRGVRQRRADARHRAGLDARRGAPLPPVRVGLHGRPQARPPGLLARRWPRPSSRATSCAAGGLRLRAGARRRALRPRHGRARPRRAAHARGASSSLAALRAAGTPVGLASNSPRAFVDKALAVAGLEGALRRHRGRRRGRASPSRRPTATSRPRPRWAPSPAALRRARGLAARASPRPGRRA